MTSMSKGRRLGCYVALALMVLMLCCSQASALSNVSFSDTNMVGTKMLIYEVNGTGVTLLGVYNSTDTGISIPDNALVTFQPERFDVFKNPEKIPDLLWNMLGPGGSFFAVIVLIIGTWWVFFGRRH